MLRSLLQLAMMMYFSLCRAGEDPLVAFAAPGYTLIESIELDHGRTLLITHCQLPDSTHLPTQLVLLHRQGDIYGVEGRMPMHEGSLGCERIDNTSFLIRHRSPEDIISELTFTYNASGCLLSGYSQDYIIQQEPELWYGHIYAVPHVIPFAEITPSLLTHLADGTLPPAD